MRGPQLAQFARGEWWVNTCFEGVYPIDRLPTVVSGPCGLIINTDPADGEGEHWVSVYINSEGVGVFFDSFGLGPPSKLRDFLRQNTVSWYHNSIPLQSVVSSKCGYYCLYFLYKSVRGYSLPGLLTPFHPQKPYCNDSWVTNWYHRKRRKQRDSWMPVTMI